MKGKLRELSSLILRSQEPGRTGGYMLACLEKQLDADMELIWGRYRKPIVTAPEDDSYTAAATG